MAPGCGCGGKVRPALPKKIVKESLEELVEKSKLESKEVKALYRRFRLLAPSGYLLPDQFRQIMGVLGMSDDPFLPDRMFMVFDFNEDGKLSFFEFASSLAIMIRGSEDEKLKLSFEMTAGRRGASSISLEDFQKLIRACNTLMQSLVTPDTNPIDDLTIRRMFRDLSSGEEASDEEAVITLEDYKAAAQSNDDFLVCLGLQAPTQQRRQRTSFTQSNFSDAKLSTPSHSLKPAGDQYLVSAAQIDELRARLATLREVVLQEPGGASWQEAEPASSSSNHDPNGTTVPNGAANGHSNGTLREDPNERWWTPMRVKNHISIDPPHGPKTVNEIASEFDKALNWCNYATEARADGDGMATRSWSREPPYSGQGPTPSMSASPSGVTLQTVTEEDRRRKNPSTASGGSDTEDGQRAGKHNPDGRHRSHSNVTVTSKRRKRHRLLGPKKGLAVHFGHENWNMVLSMMIGIRMSVGRTKHEMSRELTPVDFIMKEKFSIIPRLANIFDSEVSKRVTMTRFIDYAPMVFQRIRSSFGIDQDDYLRSCGPEQLLGNMVLGNLSSLSELSSEGKSGAFFYYTADGKYMLKTVAPKEIVLLKRMLKRYYDHITTNTGTMVVRFLGLHCLRVRKVTHGIFTKDKKLHFVVMGNMFNTPFEIHKRYDLKGSWVGRVTPNIHLLDPSIALKDVDFKQANESIQVGPEVKEQLVKIFDHDAAFLRDNNIIDYSLLLGIHTIGASNQEGDADGEEGKSHIQIRHDVQNAPGQPYVSKASLMSRTNTGATSASGFPGSPYSTMGSCPTSGSALEPGLANVPVHQRDLGGLLSADSRHLYFFGIIDILTPYDKKKVFEHHFKSLRNDKRGVSCCPPVFYAERFNDFMRMCFH